MIPLSRGPVPTSADAALIGGILQVTNTGTEAAPIYDWVRDTDPQPPEEEIVDRTLFVGIQGGFSLPAIGGLTIRLALSELAPLEVFLNVEVPGGIVIVPQIGLALNDFAAGVEFFKTLPSIEDPLALRDPAFDVTATPDAAGWLDSVRGQVFSQFLAIQANPNMNGFFAAFTSPMIIKGSARIYSIYTSQQVFNGQVGVIISTDGKLLINGKLAYKLPDGRLVLFTGPAGAHGWTDDDMKAVIDMLLKKKGQAPKGAQGKG